MVPNMNRLFELVWYRSEQWDALLLLVCPLGTFLRGFLLDFQSFMIQLRFNDEF